MGTIVVSLAPVWMAMMIKAIQDGTPSLAGPLLILSATMMGSVISEIIAVMRFTADPLPLSLVFAVFTLAATLLTGSYLRVLPASTAQTTSGLRNW